jgi:NUDIX domain
MVRRFRREMEEETGYRPRKPLRHLFGYYPSYGCGNQRFELFLADDPVQVKETPDPQEVMSTRWFSKGELVGMIARREIIDGLSLTPLLAVLLGRCRGPREGKDFRQFRGHCPIVPLRRAVTANDCCSLRF